MKLYKQIIFILIVFFKTETLFSKNDLFNVNNIKLEKKDKISNNALANQAIKEGFNQLIENGNLYLAQPPLFKITKNNKSNYMKDEKDLENFIIKNSSNKEKKGKLNSKELNKIIELEKQKLSIQRFKGLGEMNPEELWQTTLNPDNRNLLKVQYSNGTKEKSKEDQKIISILMGDEVAPRREFITSNALDVANLDI